MSITTPCLACDHPVPVRAGERVVRCPRCRTRTAVDTADNPVRSRPRVPVHILAAVGLIAVLLVGVGVFAWVTFDGRDKGTGDRVQASPAPTVATNRRPEPRPEVRPAPKPIPTPRPAPVPRPARTEPPVDEPPVKPASDVSWRETKADRPPVRLRPEWMDANVSDVADAQKRLEDMPAVVTYPAPAARPKKVAIPGYLRRTVSGFTLLVSEECHDQSDRRDGQPLACLEGELQAIAERLPESLVKQLTRVPVWVEWDHTVPGFADALAVYHHANSQASLALSGVDERKNRCVTVMTLKTVYLAKSRDKLPTNILAHELAHAVHDQCFGLDNPVVRNAFDQARTKRLYLDVKHANGECGPAYALTNEAEYFAELSACYLDRIRHEPTDAAGLREYDSAGYELMTKVWGTEKAIEQAKKADAERKAKQRGK